MAGRLRADARAGRLLLRARRRGRRRARSTASASTAATPYPDPASRFQPEGPHGPSQVVDPAAFRLDRRRLARRRPRRPGHLRDARRHLHAGGDLGGGRARAAGAGRARRHRASRSCRSPSSPAASAGATTASTSSPRTRSTARPTTSAASSTAPTPLGLGVILDVVYNHLGPDGNYLKQFADDYFTDRYKNEWGEAINFDGADSGPVREFFLANAGYWIDEFHLDGLRLDATQQHLRRLAGPHPGGDRPRGARGGARASARSSSSPRTSRRTPGWCARRSEGGYGLDALWNDDFHHSAAGRADRPQRGLLHRLPRHAAGVHLGWSSTATSTRGSATRWQKKRRGTPALDLPPAAFVNFLQNHDQVANSARGVRCHRLTSPGRFRAMTALLLLGAGDADAVPGAGVLPPRARSSTSPTTSRSWRELVRRGPARVPVAVPQPGARPRCRRGVADPGDPQTLRALQARPRGARAARRVLRPAPRPAAAAPRGPGLPRASGRGGVDGAVLGAEAFVLRFFGDERADDRLLLVNLGRDLHLEPGAGAAAGAARPAALGGRSGRARTRATAAAAAPPPDDRGGTGASPARRPWCCARSKDDGERSNGHARQPWHRCATSARAARTCPRRPMPRIAADARVAGHQRPGRLRLGHGRRRRHPPLSRPADRRPAGAAGPVDDAQPARRSVLRLPDGTIVALGGEERAGSPLDVHGAGHLREFRLEAGLPVWRYEVGRLRPGEAGLPAAPPEHRPRHLPAGRRATGRVRLELRPSVHFRPHDAPVEHAAGRPYTLTVVERPLRDLLGRPSMPPLRLSLAGGERRLHPRRGARSPSVFYRVEDSRGYESAGDLWSPGYFRRRPRPRATRRRWSPRPSPGRRSQALRPGEALRGRASSGAGGCSPAADPRAAPGLAAELVLAADQFLITPAGRVEDAARAHAAGDEVAHASSPATTGSPTGAATP